jgi:hypothetical protein
VIIKLLEFDTDNTKVKPEEVIAVSIEAFNAVNKDDIDE